MPKKDSLKTSIIETEQRWFTFIGKLEERLIELCTLAIPELQQAYTEDKDEYKRSYYHMYNGIRGQISNMTDKASDVFDDKIHSFYHELEDEVDDDDDLEREIDKALSRCAKRCREFEDSASKWTEKIKKIECVDLEADYKYILDEHEEIKNKFCCKQCGSIIPLPKLLFMATYLQCDACQTQNTFVPSSKASQLQHLGRQLAEQRTQYLLDICEQKEDTERELYHQMHELEMSIILEENKQRITSVEAQIAELEKKRQQSIANAPILYKQYLRAMFDEWNKILPDMREQNERVYEGRIKEKGL